MTADGRIAIQPGALQNGHPAHFLIELSRTTAPVRPVDASPCSTYCPHLPL